MPDLSDKVSELLLPCPFCGHAPDWSRDSSSASIYCPNEDGCSGMDVTIDAADGDAADPWPKTVERWNLRALLNNINRKTTRRENERQSSLPDHRPA